MDTSIAEGKEVRIKVQELLDQSEYENLFQAENAPGAHFSRITVWRWLNKPETVFRISIYALYKFLRSLGYTHAQVEEIRFGQLFNVESYKRLFDEKA